MRWIDVVAAYPNQWLVIEALEAHVEVVDPPLTCEASAVRSAELDAVPEPLAHPALGYDPAREDEPSDGTIASPIADPSKTTAVRDKGWMFRRVLDRVAVLELCADGRAAMHASREHARMCATREVLCVHTSYPSLHFDERVVPLRPAPPPDERALPRRRKGPSERMRASR
ncbi:MAG: hypothetical protein ACKV2T_42670 [Kofleriaceae bacterium]